MESRLISPLQVMQVLQVMQTDARNAIAYPSPTALLDLFVYCRDIPLRVPSHAYTTATSATSATDPPLQIGVDWYFPGRWYAAAHGVRLVLSLSTTLERARVRLGRRIVRTCAHHTKCVISSIMTCYTCFCR